jgi:hypothetical protein
MRFMARDTTPSRTPTRRPLALERLEPRDVPSVGSVANQAEQALRTDLATRLFGTTGTGIVVGVISDSADRVGGGMAASIASGDLPAAPQAQVLLDGPPNGTDEGRAMMELIHDIAPGATLLFASGVGGDAALANAVTLLAANGADIIVDDLNGLATEPFYQDGLAAQAITAAVAGGVTYFSSAGNQGDSGYDTPFRGANTTVHGITGRWHDFDAGPLTDPTQTVTLQPGQTTIVFQYDEPFYGGGGVKRDADLYLFDPSSGSVLASGTDDNIATGVPRQIVSYFNPSSAPITAELAVLDVSGPSDIGRFKYIGTNGLVVDDHRDEPGAIVGGADPTHGGATAAISVAASPADSPLVPEPSTGVGPVTRVFDPQGNRLPQVEVRNKPELTAVDRVDTTVPGHHPFVGTSAAAPNAAAVAALALAYRPNLTPAALRSALDASTIDIAAPGYDLVTGYGLIDATALLVRINGGTLPVTGDADFPNENDAFLLRLNPTDPMSLDVVVNGQLLGTIGRQLIDRVVVDGKGGDDTLTLDYSNGMFTVPGGIQFTGGSGTDTIAVTADAAFTLSDSALTISGGGTVTLTSVERAVLTGGPLGDSFTVSDWTGVATLAGGGGPDTYSVTLDGGPAGTVHVLDTGLDTATDALTVLTGPAGGVLSVTPGLVQLGGQTVTYDSGIEQLGLVGGTGDDTFAVTTGFGLDHGIGLTVTGGGGNDTLQLTAPAGNALLGESYLLTGAGAGTLVVASSSDQKLVTLPLNPFAPAAGTEVLRYAGITTVVDAAVAGRMDVFAGVPAASLTVRDGGPLPGGLTAGAVSALGSTLVFARKDLLTLNGLAGPNTFVVDDPTAPTGLTALELYGNEVTGGAIRPDDGSDDEFDIRSTAVPVRAFGQGGNDVFRVSSAAGSGRPGDLNGIGADLTLAGGAGTNALFVNDARATGGNADVRIAADTITGLAGPTDNHTITYSGIDTLTVAGSGAAGVSESFTVLSPAAVLNLLAGGGDDTINVVSLTSAANIDAGAGNDIVNVSSDAPQDLGTLAGIGAALTVTGGTGNTILNVGDRGDASGVTGRVSPAQVTGLGLPAPITYSAIATLNITLGDGGDTFTVLGTPATTRFNLTTGGGNDRVFVRAVGAASRIDTGAGDDAIHVSSNAGLDDNGNLDGITAPLTIDAGAGTGNTLVVSDFGGTGNTTGVVTNNRITGLAPAPIFYAAAGGAFDPSTGAGILVRGSDLAADAITVLGTLLGSTTRVEGNGGDDAIAIGGTGPSGSLDGIAGALTVDGGAGTNSLTVSDAASLSPDPGGVITASMLLGFAGPVGQDQPINYANFATLTVFGSGIGDTIAVDRPSAALTLNTGAGSDDITIAGLALPAVVNAGGGHTTVTVAGSGRTLADLAAPLKVNGGAGIDDLTVDDTAAPGGPSYVVTPTTVTRLGAPVITYAGLESLELLGSAGSGTYRIDGTGAGGTIVGGPGRYTIQGDRLTGSNTFFGGNGPDSFVVNSGGLITGSIEVDGGAGRDGLNVIGTPGDDGIALHMTSANGVGYITGLGKRVSFSGVEDVGLDAAGGTNSLAWIDDTQTSYGSPANPSGGIVFKPTGPTSGQITVAGGAVLPVVTFVNINGSFNISGDGDGSGDKDALTVLGVSTTGRQSSLGEATSADGSDTVVVTDQLVTITNAVLGPLRSVGLDLPGGAPSISVLVVRPGDEPAPAGDSVTVTPSNRVDMLMIGAGNDKLTVATRGPRDLQRVTDPALGPGTLRVVQLDDGAGVNAVGFRSVAGTNIKVVGTDAGVPAEVRVYDAATNALRFTLDPFPGFTGGLSVAAGDVNGDGVPDIIVGAGNGGGPAILVYDGVDGSLLSSFFAYEESFRGGVLVAAGDVNGDGHADIIAGTGVGGGPRVLVFSGADYSILANFFAYEESFRNGVLVAAGDVNGDGKADILTGTGPGGAPRVLVFDGATFKVLYDFYAMDPAARGGVNVGLADLNGDGHADLIIGSGIGEVPQVLVFSGVDLTPLANLQLNGGKSETIKGGVRVAATDLDGSGTPDLLVSEGAGGDPSVRGYKVVSGTTQPVEIGTDTPFGPDYLGGIYVGGSS